MESAKNQEIKNLYNTEIEFNNIKLDIEGNVKKAYDNLFGLKLIPLNERGLYQKIQLLTRILGLDISHAK